MEVTVYESSQRGTPIYGDPTLQASTPPIAPVIVVYSDDQTCSSGHYRRPRKAVTRAKTREHKVVDFATADALRQYLSEKRAGGPLYSRRGGRTLKVGMGLAHALKDEIIDCPAIMVIIARPQDSWLATWSGAQRPSSHIRLTRLLWVLRSQRLLRQWLVLTRISPAHL
jgi:hypothetical protein